MIGRYSYRFELHTFLVNQSPFLSGEKTGGWRRIRLLLCLSSVAYSTHAHQKHTRSRRPVTFTCASSPCRSVLCTGRQGGVGSMLMATFEVVDKGEGKTRLEARPLSRSTY